MFINKPFGAYNERRYSKPWGALITFPDRIKPAYKFCGHWDGETVVLEANEGDVVAFGQKDNRGSGTRKTLFIVGADGELTETTEAQARKHFNERNVTNG